MNLRKRALGMSLGTLWGLVLFAATVWSTLQGKGATLILLKGYYPGFTISYTGAFIGLIWGFVSGFIGGMLIAWLYEAYCKLLYRSS
jgi:hypothetical protein